MSTKNGVRGINYTNSNSKWNTSNKNKEQRKKIILARWLGEGLVECQIGETYHFISAIKNDEFISEIKYSNGIELRNIHRREIRMIISSKYITYASFWIVNWPTSKLQKKSTQTNVFLSYGLEYVCHVSLSV